VDAVLKGGAAAEQDPKLRALLAIAEAVAASPQGVGEHLVAAARAAGADDIAIHDAVLIASAFCMYNRYVDGLATFQPADDAAYVETGERLAREGYSWPPKLPAPL
jgi:alkylhydroperoxidase family enzyme